METINLIFVSAITQGIQGSLLWLPILVGVAVVTHFGLCHVFSSFHMCSQAVQQQHYQLSEAAVVHPTAWSVDRCCQIKCGALVAIFRMDTCQFL